MSVIASPYGLSCLVYSLFLLICTTDRYCRHDCD